MNIKEKLNIIQISLKAPKGQYNKFGNYKFRNCEDILEGLKPKLKETKTILILTDEIVMMGSRFYVKATATLMDCESEESLFNNSFAREEENKKGMDGSQVTGASSSYARKYALSGLLGIDDTKDADSQSSQEPQKPQIENDSYDNVKNLKIDKIKLSLIQKELERTGILEAVVCKSVNVASITDITEGMFVRVMDNFKKTPDKKV